MPSCQRCVPIFLWYYDKNPVSRDRNDEMLFLFNGEDDTFSSEKWQNVYIPHASHDVPWPSGNVKNAGISMMKI